MEQEQLAYIEAFNRWINYAKGTNLTKEQMNPESMKLNLEIARDYYKKINDKNEVPIFLIKDLNQLEKEFGMEITQ